MFSKHMHPTHVPADNKEVLFEHLLNMYDKELHQDLFDEKSHPSLQPISLPDDKFVVLDEIKIDSPPSDIVLEIKPETPPTDFIRLEPSRGAIREQIEEKINTTTCMTTRSLLCLISLVFGSGSESWQFRDGMKDISGKVLGLFENTSTVTWFVTAIYFMQSVTINRKFTNDGIDQLCRLFKGERPADWEELSVGSNVGAALLSFLTNGYALFSDAAANAYYLNLSGINSNPICFMLGVVTALSTLPTEGLQNYLTMRALFSITEKTLKNSLENIQESDIFKALPEIAQQRFEPLWTELSIFLKIALQHPENKYLLKEDGKELADELQKLFYMNKSEIVAHLLTLKIEPDTAEILAEKISLLSTPTLSEQPQSTALQNATKALKLLEQFTKLSLKFFGASQDVISSFVTVAAMFSVTSSPVKFILLLLSLANGVNDLVFCGKNSEEALDCLKEKLMKGMPSSKEIVVFAVSLLFAGMIGQAQLDFILSMLRDPDSTLPAPFPELLPETLSLVLSWGAAARETVNYTYYLAPIIDHGLNEFMRKAQLLYDKYKERTKTASIDQDLVVVPDENKDWMMINRVSAEKRRPKVDSTPIFQDGYFALPPGLDELDEPAIKITPELDIDDPNPTASPSSQRMSSASESSLSSVTSTPPEGYTPLAGSPSNAAESKASSKPTEGILSYLSSRFSPLQRFSLLSAESQAATPTAREHSAPDIYSSLNHY